MKTKYSCIECRECASELYKDFNGGGVIKISHCNQCGNVVDKYIEYEPVLVFLDAVLHKRPAYRHLLFNETRSVWKLLLMYLACDAYITWDNLDPHRNISDEKVISKELFYAALQQDIYIMYFISAIVWIFGCAVSVLLLLSYDLYHQLSATQTVTNLKDLTRQAMFTHRALVISSFGKLLAVPAVIWGQTHSAIYLTLAQVFVLTSNISALHAVRDTGAARYSLVVMLALLVSHLLQITVRQSIVNYLYT